LGLPRKTVTRHLRALARAGIIKCVVARTIAKQLPLEVIINPKLLPIIGKRSTLTTARQLARSCAQLWLERGDLVNADVQGWDHETTTPFGRVAGPRIDSRRDERPTEPIDHESDQNGTEAQQSPTQSVAEIVDTYLKENPERERKETKVERLKRERADYRKQVDTWIDGAAKAWTHFQNLRGVTIPEGPSWGGDKHALPKQVAGERRELEKLVAMYGGRRLAVAWIVFISGHMIPDKKDAERPAFIPDRAPWQFTTPDKRPSHFSKHINLIIEHAQKLDWENNDEKFLPYLVEKFGSALDVAPQAKMYSRRPITTDNTAKAIGA
jgi:hypothetical protein